MGAKIMNKRGNRPAESSAPKTLISPEIRYKNIFDKAGEGIYQSSVSGQILDVNPALARFFGYHSPEEMKKDVKDVSRQIYADTSMWGKTLRMVDDRGHAKFEFRFRRRDNTMGWGYASKHAVRNAQGKIVYYEGFFLDITDRKKMEEKLREAHNLLEQRVIERTRKIAQLNRNLAADIAKRKKVEKELKRRSVKLKEFNIALRTLLDQRESDRKALEQQIMTNIDDLILPGIERLKDTALTQEASAIIQSLQENLQNLTSPFLSRIKADACLTFKELHIANFIKKGNTSKEIGALMKLSTSTVNLHRNNIRKKLGLRGEKVSLQSHLLSRL
ncbi:MAG: PAS domain S-box protein [Syntrophaceae bacterium]|nr:PAS domain S-box protein [Syntrophaceae bacterium]